MPSKVDEVLEKEVGIPAIDVIREVKNDQGEDVTFGGKNFKILSLKYEDYCEFLELLTPFLEPLFNSDPNVGFDVKGIVKMLNRSLPRMVHLMFHVQDPDVTEEWVKSKALSPFELAIMVFKQIEKNQMVKAFTDFFVLMRTSGML